MRLKTLLIAFAFLLAALALGAAGGMVLVAEYARDTAEYLIGAIESVRIAEKLEADLMTASTSPAATRKEVVARLRRGLSDAERLIQSPEEARMVGGAREAVSAYVQALERGAAPEALLTAATGAVRGLSEINVAQAEAAHAKASSRSRRTAVWAGGMAALLALATLGALYWARRRVLLPLEALDRAISSAAHGAPHTRARLSGAPELQALAARFNEMAEVVDRQRGDRLALLVRASDHLREPLEALRGVAESLPPQAPLPDEAELRRRVGTLARQVGRVERMLDEFVDAVRIEDGSATLTRTELDARGLVSEAVELIRERSAEHQIELRAGALPLIVFVDATRVAQVLNNVLSRAISCIPAGGKVQVRAEQQGEQALIAVRADATGPAPQLEPLFNAMHRLDRSMRAVPGTLFGLEVSRKIVEGHGGTVQVTEETPRAFALELRLPLCRPAQPQAAGELVPAASAAS